MAVPERYKHVAGKAKVQQSLGTADLVKAKRLRDELKAELIAHWRQLAGEPPLARSAITPDPRVPSRTELEDAAVAIGHEIQLEDSGARRRSLLSLGEWGYDVATDLAGEEHRSQARANARGDLSLVQGLADEVIEALNYSLPRGSADYKYLCDAIGRVRFAATSLELQRLQGDLEARSSSNLVSDVLERRSTRAAPGESIQELFELWAAEMLAKGEKRADTVNQDRKVINQFAAFVGSGRSIDSITAAEVEQYRDTLRDLPPKWTSNKLFRGMNMRTAAAKARELDLPRLAFTTVNKHLSTVSPLYDWLRGRKKGRWPNLTNPVAGLHYDKVKGRNPRAPFTTAALNQILQSPLFTGFRAEGLEHEPGNVQADDWRKWVPLACLFTGARIGEIAQLRVGDVRQDRGIWFMHICHDEKGGLTTKSGKSRPAAVHVILAEIGFLAFHDRQMQRAQGDLAAPLFPELLPNSRGQISGMPSRWWRDYLAAIGIKNGADGMGAHTFRHTLADRLRSEAELLDDQIAVCLGHNQKSTTAGYGELAQGTVTMFKDWMDRLIFEGVEFDHLKIE